MRNSLIKKGFTLLQVMIVVAIVIILAAVAIPNLLRSRINSNDGAVKEDLRAFSTAAESYRISQTTPTYPDSITSLTNGNRPFLDSSWSSGNPLVATKHGHTVTYNFNNGSYYVTAVPQAGASVQNYCIDHTGVLKVGSGTNSSGCTSTVTD